MFKKMIVTTLPFLMFISKGVHAFETQRINDLRDLELKTEFINLKKEDGHYKAIGHNKDEMLSKKEILEIFEKEDFFSDYINETKSYTCLAD